MGRKYKLLQGPDASLDISLLEYGFAWIDDPDSDDIEVFYGIELSKKGDQGYTVFDNAQYKKDLDPKQEWDWVKWEEVASTNGVSVEDLLKQPLPMIIYDLFRCHGYENVFGSTYWGALYWNKNIQRFQLDSPQDVVLGTHRKQGHFVEEDQ